MNNDERIIGKKQDGLVKAFLEQAGLTGTPTFEVKLVNTVSREVLDKLGEDNFNSRYLYMRKIDLLIDSADAWHVVEAKPILNCEAIGQALLYRKEWAIQSKQGKPVKAWITCRKADETLIKLCNDYNIEVFVIE